MIEGKRRNSNEKVDLTMIELCSGIGAQVKGVNNTELFNVDVLATADLDKEVVVSYAAMHCGLTNEMINEYESYPSKEQMVNELVGKRLGYDFKKDIPYDWAKLSKKKDKTKGIEKYWLADHLSKNLGDMMQINCLPSCDLLTYSTPCFTENTYVLTKNGIKKIVDVTNEDEVLTHNNQYRKVLSSKCTGTKNIYVVDAMCSNKTECTENHKFYVREKYRVYPTYENGRRGNIRKFREPKWVECKDLSKDYYLGFAINQNAILPNWDGIYLKWNDSRKTRHKNEIESLLNNHSFWWIVGRYLGDGWIRKNNGITICCNKSEVKEILPHIRNCGFNYNIVEERTVNKIQISRKELELFFEAFGHGAENKKIPNFVFDMPKEYLQSLVDGYVSADGNCKDGRNRVTSVSKELIYGFAQLVAKAYNCPFSINFTKRNPIVFIEGRKCNQRDSWELTWKDKDGKQDKAFYEDGYIWFPIRSVEKTNREEKVYDIEVEEDHSFTANGCIVHNCTDLSIAGKQEGLKWTCQNCGEEYDPSTLDVDTRYTCPKCGSHNIKSTRSGLLYEVERLLVKAKENNTLPKFLLMENVDALVSKKYIDSFTDWIERLENLGYNSYYQTINAKNTGIPQNRNRIFCISILKDIDTKSFEFPKPFDTGIRLKDMLETDSSVLEKYFLSDEVQSRLQITDSKFEKNVVATTKPEFRTLGQRDLVYQKDSVMGALVATDYKQPKQILETANEPIHIADLCSEKFQRMHEQSRRVYSEDGISPAMHTCGGGNTEPKVERENLKVVRKLTPKEAHRLMGFDDEDYEKCKAVGMSDTQGYKQSGNSIVTTCIKLIAEHLYKAQYDNTYVCYDENFTNPQAE